MRVGSGLRSSASIGRGSSGVVGWFSGISSLASCGWMIAGQRSEHLFYWTVL